MSTNARLRENLRASGPVTKDQKITMVAFTRIFFVFVVSVCYVGAFVAPCRVCLARPTWASTSSPSKRTDALQMGWGDALGKAFANEDMGAAKNPGLKNEPNACMVRVVIAKPSCISIWFDSNLLAYVASFQDYFPRRRFSFCRNTGRDTHMFPS